jgi:hypothetical protein
VWLKTNEVLFSDATIKLGEIHWSLLKSVSAMDSKRWTVTKATIGSNYEDTELAKKSEGMRFIGGYFKKRPISMNCSSEQNKRWKRRRF